MILYLLSETNCFPSIFIEKDTLQQLKLNNAMVAFPIGHETLHISIISLVASNSVLPPLVCWIMKWEYSKNNISSKQITRD